MSQYDQLLQALFRQTSTAAGELEEVYEALLAVKTQVDAEPKRYPVELRRALRRLLPKIEKNFSQASFSYAASIGSLMQELSERPRRSPVQRPQQRRSRPRQSYVRELRR